MNDATTQLERHAAPENRWAELVGVVKMSFPMVVATCCRMMMDVTDFWMISRTGDDNALAAILPAQMIIWSYVVIGMGTVSIVNTMASQALGRGRLRDCSAYAWQVLYLSGAFWLVGAMLWPGLRGLFALAGHSPEIQNLEWQYAKVTVWTVGSTIAAAGLGQFFAGIHRPRVTMWCAMEGIAVNAVVSYVLIFGKLGFEPMGIVGAAWGTVAGTGYRAIRFTVTLCVPSMHERFAARHTWRFDWRKSLNIFRIGGPSGLQWCSDVTVWAIFTAVLVGRYFGPVHQIATNSAWQYLRISFMPCVGVGMALSAMVGRAIGEGDPQRAIRLTRISVLLMLGYMALMSSLYLIAREDLIAFFNDDAEVIRIGASVMVCAAVFQIFDALGITYYSSLRGAGDTFVPAVMFVVTHWVIVIGGGFLVAELAPQLGSVGPWMAASALIILTGLYLWRRWHRRGWMKIDIFKHDEPVVESPGAEPVAGIDAALEPVRAKTETVG